MKKEELMRLIKVASPDIAGARYTNSLHNLITAVDALYEKLALVETARDRGATTGETQTKIYYTVYCVANDVQRWLADSPFQGGKYIWSDDHKRACSMGEETARRYFEETGVGVYRHEVVTATTKTPWKPEKETP